MTESKLESDYLFDFRSWRQALPSNEFFHGARQGFLVVGPRDIIPLEHWREEARGKTDLGPFAPTDAFVLAVGEPKRRDVTKVGGIPYWPAAREWPRHTGGRAEWHLNLSNCFSRLGLCRGVDVFAEACKA